DEEPETRPLEAILDDEERLDAGLTIARLRLRASPHTFYTGRHSGWFIAEDRDEALRLERQVDPRATLEQIPPVHGTQWEIDLDPQPDRRLAPLGWWFVTAEPPPRRE